MTKRNQLTGGCSAAIAALLASAGFLVAAVTNPALATQAPDNTEKAFADGPNSATLQAAGKSASLKGLTAPTPFRLGAYLGNPDGSDPSLETLFEQNVASFAAVTSADPKLIVAYVDYTQPVSSWISNASWQAWSNAQSSSARTMVPVVGLPMASIAPGSPTPDVQFKMFASGQYDYVIQGVVQSWAGQGFKHLIIRPGWEMNLVGPTYVGDDAQSQADWVAAFRHIYVVLHKAATAAGVTMRVVWNPGVTNYSNALATTNLYPGDGYVNVIGADMYSDMNPYLDYGQASTYYDWDTGRDDYSLAQFVADPINRVHYWTYPAATRWSTDGSGGHSQSFLSLMSFAQAHNKPFALPETGAGNCNGGTDVCDDPTFPQWLAQQLTQGVAAGLTVAFVNVWDNNGGGNYEFTYASDNKPQEAAAWGTYFGAH